MKEDWTDQLRKKLEGHEVTPPKSLWEDICKGMGVPAGIPESKPAASKRWLWAAAALIFALVGFFAVYHVTQGDGSFVTSPNITKEPSPCVKAEIPTKVKPLVKFLASTQEKAQGVAPNIEAAAPTESKPSIESEIPEESEPSIQEETSQTTKQTETVMDTPMQTLERPQVGDRRSGMPYIKHKQTSNKWSLGLNVSGGLLAANNTVQTTGRLYTDYYSIPYGYGYATFHNHENIYDSEMIEYSYYVYTDYVWKHRLPIRLGLSMQYQLNNHFALFSGINYTYLYSECSIPLHQNLHYDQKLHYLGVPLGIVWQLWSTSHFRVYLSGSTMLEKCINSKLTNQASQTVESKKPWQWSVQTAAGAEYLFTPQFGAYLEPSLGYYFDDGTSLMHYYKEHSFAPSLEFGLRLHISK